LIKRVNNVIRITIDDSDKGWRAWIIEGKHHIEVYFACFAFDFDLKDAFELDVSARLTVLSCLK
jgi:hypothetical protein